MYYALTYWNILSVINELNAAGAECISINGERITASSQISNQQTSILLRLMIPDQLKARIKYIHRTM
ncbi:MAG: DUF881 domain-containing protein [Syntrophomonadaceae bacterium]|nr:DUF881 domain-containing protein [Syntrophomonadaceae bacterium]